MTARPPIQLSFDAADPKRLGQFWAQVLGYVEQSPPPGFDSWDAFLDAEGVPPGDRDKAYAIVDPDGNRPRIYLQKVPEAKLAKNRLHLDVNVGSSVPAEDRTAAVRQRADEVIALGATEVREVSELGEYWIVLRDIEGNEFCLQ